LQTSIENAQQRVRTTRLPSLTASNPSQQASMCHAAWAAATPAPALVLANVPLS